jgi:hypothetical protein
MGPIEGLAGRYGQAHRSNHAMEERSQCRIWLHDLQAQHPELTIHDILALAQHAD